MTPDRRAESGNESSAALAGASAPRSRLPLGGTRVLLWPLRLSMARAFGICPFGLQAEINFALTDRLEVVFVRDATFVSKLGRPSEGELQGPILPRK